MCDVDIYIHPEVGDVRAGARSQALIACPPLPELLVIGTAWGEQSNIDPKRLLNLLHQAGTGMRVSPDHKIYARAPDGDSTALFAAARNLLANLGAS